MLFRAILTTTFLALSTCVWAQSQPPQSAGGPGGSGLPYRGATTTARSLFPDDKSYWIITPTGWARGGVAPAKLPLVIFLHGYGLSQPSDYASWINHIVRGGNVVIFPKYQGLLNLAPSSWTNNAIAAVKDAVSKPFPGTPPDLSLGMILVSHSAGGLVSANMANRFAANRLPAPRALVLAMPWYDPALDRALSGVPAATRLLCVVGNTDSNVGRRGCDAIWDRTPQVRSRSYVWMYGDSHGQPELVANHFVAADAQSPVNALDWNGLWKFSDAMRSCVFGGRDCNYIDGSGPQQTGLGRWSDGVPVRPMTVSATKPACPSGSAALGCSR
jgi:pimeloyl-ACP methyl ester carboxylesterase